MFREQLKSEVLLSSACQDSAGHSLAYMQMMASPDDLVAIAAGQAGPEAAARVPGTSRADVKPPSGNTGGKFPKGSLFEEKPGLMIQRQMGLTVCLDGFGCTFPKEKLRQVQVLVSRYIRSWGTDGGKGLHWYERTYWWESKAVVAWSEGRPEAWLSVNGQTMALLELEEQMGLIRELDELGAVGSRMDPAADDYSHVLLRMSDVHQAAEAGFYVGCKRYDARRPWKNRQGDLEGDTAYFGRRGSDGSGRYVRFYDKRLESKGRVDCIRYEVEASQEYARALFASLASSHSPESFLRKIAEFLGGAIDFRLRKGCEKNIKRLQRCAWWQVIVDRLGSVKYRNSKVIPPLQKTIEYWDRNWTRTLAKAACLLDEQGYDGVGVLADRIRRMQSVAREWRPGASLDLERLLSFDDANAGMPEAVQESGTDFLGRPFDSCNVPF
jgi:hypothetical protein